MKLLLAWERYILIFDLVPASSKVLLSDVTNNHHCFLSNSTAVVTGHSYFCAFCFKGTMLGFDDKTESLHNSLRIPFNDFIKVNYNRDFTIKAFVCW